VTWPEEVRGESSWLAAPFLDQLPAGTLVLHQVREPIAVVRSFLRTRFFESRTGYRALAEVVEPELAHGTLIERCVKYWVLWNRLSQRAERIEGLVYRRHRLEDVDAGFLGRVLGELGLHCDSAHVDEVLKEHPRDTNTSGSKIHDGSLSLSSLPEGRWKDELIELAARYGYCSEQGDGTLGQHHEPRAPFARREPPEEVQPRRDSSAGESAAGAR
jgi:hypothetical protein